MSKKILAIIFFVLMVSIVGSTFFFAKKYEPAVVINGHRIAVDLATTEKAWQDGLSWRSALAPDTGMLFIFDREFPWAIWMKDMQFSIDILWIAKDKHIVKIQEYATPESYTRSQTIWQPDQDVLYVIEVPSGTVKNDGIALGQSVDFNNI